MKSVQDEKWRVQYKEFQHLIKGGCLLQPTMWPVGLLVQNVIQVQGGWTYGQLIDHSVALSSKQSPCGLSVTLCGPPPEKLVCFSNVPVCKENIFYTFNT